MARKTPPPSRERVKDIADRAEGLKPERHPGGRPTAYQAGYAQQAAKLCVLGATDAEMADFFGVAQSTFYRWKNEFPEFSETLKVAKEAADTRVEKSLYHRAVGYTFESEKIFQFQGEVIRAPVKEHVPPDTTACIFWLKNRRKEQWREKQEVEHSGAVTLEQLVGESLPKDHAQPIKK